MILNHLDLFSGIGGFSLGLERTGGFRTIGFCETDAYCTKVLQKNFPGIPIHGDIRKLKGTHFGAVDIITGGYPCQPFSLAGRNRKGEQDPRHLWPEMFRIIKESRPTWVIGENVAGHLKLGLDTVLKNLESEGYAVRTFSISASSVGANHQRERIWIVAHSDNTENRTSQYEINKNGEKKTEIRKDEPQSKFGRQSKNVANTHGLNGSIGGSCRNVSEIGGSGGTDENGSGENAKRIPNPSSHETLGSEKHKGFQLHSQWETEPDVGRVVDGVPNRVDRIRSLGNSLIPHIPYYIGQSIIATYEDNDTVQTEGTSKDNT